MEGSDQLRQLEARLADLKRRMPAHSIRPAMLLEIEDLEEEIARLRAESQGREGGDAQGAA